MPLNLDYPPTKEQANWTCLICKRRIGDCDGCAHLIDPEGKPHQITCTDCDIPWDAVSDPEEIGNCGYCEQPFTKGELSFCTCCERNLCIDCIQFHEPQTDE